MNLIQVVLDKIFPKNVNFKKYSIILIALVAAGAFMSFYGVPKLVEMIVKFLTVLKPGRFIRQKHEDKLPFTYKLYLWNVTNPEQILAGTEKPKMQEVGPYVFKQFKQKVDTVDNIADDTFTFDLWNIYYLDPELSAPLTGDEVVTVVDAVLVAVITKIQLERPHQMGLVIEAMDTIFKKPSTIFVTMKALDFIYKGIEIDCNQTVYAAKTACKEMRRTKTLKVLNEDKTLLRYRWFDKLNDTIQARYTVLRGAKNIHDVGRVTTVNDSPTIKVYKQDEQRKCNIINGTDKLFFPPFQKKSDVIWTYADDACKSYPLRYAHMKTVRGAKTAWKNLDLKDPLLDPICECNKYAPCTVHGTMDMFACLDIFVLGSLPHFYLAEPSILATLEGMEPKEHLHKSGVYFDLQTGSPVLAHERYQVSWLVRRVPEYPIFSEIAGDVWIPLMWYEETFSLQKSDLALIIFSRYSEIAGIGTGYVLMSIGMMGLVVLAARFYYNASKWALPGPIELSSAENRGDRRYTEQKHSVEPALPTISVIPP